MSKKEQQIYHYLEIKEVLSDDSEKLAQTIRLEVATQEEAESVKDNWDELFFDKQFTKKFHTHNHRIGASRRCELVDL